MENKILEAMASGEPMRPGDIATASGLEKDVVSKEIKKLVVEDKVFSPKRCFYQIKK